MPFSLIDAGLQPDSLPGNGLMDAGLAISGVAFRVLTGGSGGNWLFRITGRVQCRNPASVRRLSDLDIVEAIENDGPSVVSV
jgi:hypothetical protein